jgi:hypothetical protein
MSADISMLGNLRPVEPLDMDSYVDNQEAPPLPKKGRYTVQAPDKFPQPTFGRSKADALTARVDPIIVGPDSAGYTLKFTNPSAKVYKRQGVNVSQIGDYLRACGIRGKIVDEQSLADAVESTANLTYQVDVDWRAYNKATGFQLEGMDNFMKNDNGEPVPYCIDKGDTEKDENGATVFDAAGVAVPKRLRANLYITRYVPAA